MLIPQEYKQTEFGVVPKDWDITTIGKACYINPNNGEIPNKFLYIDLESVNRGFLEKKKYINKKEAPSRAQRLVKKKDVLFQLVRPYQQNNYFNTKYTVAVASTGYAVLREHLINIDLIYQIIHTKNFTKQVLDKCTGTSYPAITSTNFENVKFCYPKNYLEQKCIATVLNDTDKLINNLNKLIKKKIAIKQGVMQELLTGKRRLPGFNGKWVKKRLENFIFIQNGYSFNSETFSDIGVNVIRISDINNKIINCKKTVKYDGVINPNFCVHKNDILIAMSGATVGKVGVYMDNKISYINQRVGKVVLKGNNINTYFLFNFFCSKIFEKILGEIITAGAQPNISGKQIEDIYLKIPQVREQEAIANILSDMDDEIKKLEIKLQKYKKIKQGMMQQLLTGRIRLLD